VLNGLHHVYEREVLPPHNAITTQICTAEQDYVLSENTEAMALAAASLLDRVGRFCRELLVMAQLMTYARQLLG
jgi:hypothetical protein